MDRKKVIPRRKQTVPENIVIPPLTSSSNTVISEFSVSPISSEHEQTTTLRAKLPYWQSSRSAGLPPESGMVNRYPSSLASWGGKGGLQSPRLHGFSPREFNEFETRKSAVESVPEEYEREIIEDKAKGKETEEELTFDTEKKDRNEDKEIFGETLIKLPAVEGSRVREGRESTPANLTLSLISGVGILPDEVHSLSAQLPSPESDTNQSYRSLNQSRLSATDEATLLSALNSPVPITSPSTALTDLTKELPPLPGLPMYPQPRFSPLLPPPNLESRSRLASITPSLAAELDLEDKNIAINVKPSIEILHGVQNKFKGRKLSGKRGENVPILSSFSTDTSLNSSAEEGVEATPLGTGAEMEEKHQADYLPLNTVSGQLNLLQIERRNSITGRKRSIKRKPVHGKLRLVEEWKMKSRSNSAPNVGSNFIAGPITEESSQMLNLKTPSHQRHSYSPLTQQSLGICPKQPLNRMIQYEGYAVRLPTGVYVPLHTDTPPLAVDESLLFRVVPKRDLDDEKGTAYHIIFPNESTTPDADLRGDNLYVFDEASRGFLPEQIQESKNEIPGDGTHSIGSMQEFQWPLRDDVVISEERVKHTKPQRRYYQEGSVGQVEHMTNRWSGNFHEETFQDPLNECVGSHSAINTKQARVFGLDWGTRGVGNIDYIKSLEGETSSVVDGDWNQQDIGGDSAHEGNIKLPGGCQIRKHGIHVARDFGVESMYSRPVKEQEEEEVNSMTDAETCERKTNMNMNEQSWLEISGDWTAAESANNNSPGWGESGNSLMWNIASFESVEAPVSPVREVQTTITGGVNALHATPRLPIYNPPQDRDDTFIQAPLLTTPPLPKLSPAPLEDESIPQTPAIVPEPTFLLTPPKPRKRYVTVTLNLYRSRSEPPRTTRVLIPVSSAVKEFDDKNIFGRIRKEYKSMIGGEWRTWLGLKGIKWVGINEHPKPSKRLRSLSTSNSHFRVHNHPGSISHPHNNNNNFHHYNNHNTAPLDPTLTKSTQLIRFISKPHTARNQHGYINLLRSGIYGPRLATYSIEIVEDWVPWKVGTAGIIPILGSVTATIVWYFVDPGNGREMGLGAFQIGILVAVLGWGVVGLLVLLS